MKQHTLIEPVELDNSKPLDSRIESIALGAILIVAVILRIYRLGDWGLEGDELNTLRDSLTTNTLRGPKPLLFFLNYYLIGSWTDFNELNLRLFPALFGVASVIAVYGFTRATTNATTALLAAGLVTIAPAQLYWSQFARYYTLAYFLIVISTWASYSAIRQHSIRWSLVAILSIALAWKAHPSTALVVAAIAAWGLWQFITRRTARSHERRVGFHLRVALVVSITALAAFCLWLPTLSSWYQTKQPWGYDRIHLTLGHIDAVTPALFAAGVAGMLCLWTTGKQPLATLFAAIAFIPFALVLVLSYWVATTQGYLFVSTFVYPIGAAYLIDRLAAGTNGWSVRRIAAAMLLLGLMLEAAPKVWSQYCDGSRADFRAACHLVNDRVAARDLVLADQGQTVRHYLKEVPLKPLHRKPGYVANAWQDAQHGSPESKLWIVTEFRRRGGFHDQDLGPESEWIIANGRLVATFAHSRLDYKHNEVRVYLVDQSTEGFPGLKPID